MQSPGAEAQRGRGRSSRRAARLLPILLPPLAFALLYLPSLDYAFAWTDEDAIGRGSLLRPEGETLQAFREPLHRIPLRGDVARQQYYRPLPVVILSVVDQRFGREALAFRLATLAVGASCVAAFGGFALLLLGRPGPALFAALFLALHPVAIESTVWIAGMPAATCALFVLAALALAWQSSRAGRAAVAGGLALASLLALAAGLLAKERAAVEPALLLAMGLSLGAPGRWRRLSFLVVCHALLVAGYVFVLRPAVLGHVTAGLPPIQGSYLTQGLTSVAEWPRQLFWLFAPLHSSTSDVVRITRSFAEPWLWLGAALPLASLLGWLLLRRAGHRVAALGLAWIWLAYLPTAGFVPQLHASGERYLYLSSLGAALFLAELFAAAPASQAPRWRRWLATALAGALLLALAQRTHARLPDWSSSRRLFTADVGRDETYREAYFQLGVDYFRSGDHAEARRWVTPLLERDRRFAGTWSYLNWLSLAELACQNDQALGDYEAVLKLEKWLRNHIPDATRAPTLRICFAQARDALGQEGEALALYLPLAGELGRAAPPQLYLWIARDYAKLGQRSAALLWIGEARRQGGMHDPALAREIRRLEASLGGRQAR